MDLLDRLLGHDVWTTWQLLDLCETLPENQLDQEFEIGHRTLRNTFDHLIYNLEVWSALMAGEPFDEARDRSIEGLRARLQRGAERLQRIAREIGDRHAWDETWCDVLDDPPSQKSYGTGIAHIITHSMHHRAQILNMLRRSGLTDLPEGDVFSWENASNRGAGEM